MKKIGIITLTRQNSLAYSALKRIVLNLGYEAVCGEAIGTDCIYFPLEEINLVGHDFLADFFKRAGFSDADSVLISVPYTVNLFMLPKVIRCLRAVGSAPIILGGNEASNNFFNLMTFGFSPFVNDVADIAPDFIVRGAAETALPGLLPLLDKTTMGADWDKPFLLRILNIPNLVFRLPKRKALFSTIFSSKSISEKEIFLSVKYGEESMAITFQRACIWSKKSRGGCLFCAIAKQFGHNFHCAVEGNFFEKELSEAIRENPQIRQVDIWDDTFNVNEAWTSRICRSLKDLNSKIGKDVVYSCFLRPKGLNAALVEQMRAANIRGAFIGADAVTDDLSKRLRRGCSVSDMDRSIEVLAKGGIIPSISVQLFTPESTADDVGMTAALAMECIRDGKSTVHAHLYMFPLFGSDIHELLEARNNLKTIPAPLLKRIPQTGFEPFRIPYDYTHYDPDVEEIRQRTYQLLDIETSFYVRTYPGDQVDSRRLKAVLSQIRNWCIEIKRTHPVKTLWTMAILTLEDEGGGLTKNGLLNRFSKNEPASEIPDHLRKTHGDFGYRYTLSRSLEEVVDILVRSNRVDSTKEDRIRLTPNGKEHLISLIKKIDAREFKIAAFGRVGKRQLLDRLARAT